MIKEKDSFSEEEILVLKRCIDSKRKLLCIIGEKERDICESLCKKGYLRLICSDGGLFLKQTSSNISRKSYYTEVFYKLQKEPEVIKYESSLSKKRWALFDILRNKNNSKISYLENHALKLKINKLKEIELNKLLNRVIEKMSPKKFQVLSDFLD